MAVSGAVNGGHENILEVVEVFYFHILNDVVPVLPLTAGFEVENKFKYLSLNWGQRVKLAI